MIIETIYEIPKMERDDAVDGYAYPEEFRNKLYIFKDQYVYLKTGSYESFPKSILDAVIQNNLGEGSIPTYDGEPSFNFEEIKEFIESEMGKYKDQLNSMTESFDIDEKIGNEIKQLLPDLINSQINNLIDKFNNRLDDFAEQLRDKPSLEDMNHKFISTLQKIKDKSSPNEQGEVSVGIDETKVQLMIDKELEVVHDTMKGLITSIVNDKLHELPEAVPYEYPSPIGGLPDQLIQEEQENSFKSNAQSNKLNIELLLRLKTAGFSTSDIIILKDRGFI